MSGQSSDNQRIEFANTLRGIACMLVVCAHYGGVFWFNPAVTTQFTNIPAPSPEWPVPYLFRWAGSVPYLHLGPLGVALFFLISGFVIPISLEKQSSFGFVVSRFFRIVPCYAVGFCFTLATLLATAALFEVTAPFTWKEALAHIVPGVRDLSNSKNIDGIIWTLEIEIKFYTICALFHWIPTKSPTTILWIPIVLAGLGSILAIFHSSFAGDTLRFVNLFLWSSTYLIYMFIGVVLYLHYTRRIRSETAMFFASGFFGLTLLLSYIGPYAASFPYMLNYGVAVVLFLGAMAFPLWLKSTRLLDYFSAISYPLYVIHAVAGYAIMRVLQSVGWSPYLIIFITSVIVLIVATLIHKFVELPSQRLGKRIVKQWSDRSVMPSSFRRDTTKSVGASTK